MRKHHTSSSSASTSHPRRFAGLLTGVIAAGTVAATLLGSAPTASAQTPGTSTAATAVHHKKHHHKHHVRRATGKHQVVTAGQQALSFAERQLGKPYIWGGTGPGGYDCSGLTQASWAAAGVAIARVAADQYWSGAHYPLADAQPGDLIFWSSNGAPSGIYHVGMYVGNGEMINAPHTGTDVQIDMIWPGVYPEVTRP